MIRAALHGWMLPRPVLVKATTLVAMAVAPAVVGAAVLPLALVATFLIGVSAGFAISIVTTSRMTMVLAVVYGIAGAAGIAVGANAVAAGLATATASLLVAPAAERGFGPALTMAPIVVVIAAFGVLGRDPALALLGIPAGIVWMTFVTRVHAIRIAPAPMDRRVAWVYGLGLAIAAGAATGLAIALDLSHGYWLVLTLAVTLQPMPAESTGQVRDRVLGTMLGALLGVAAGAVIAPWLVVAAVLIAAILGIAYSVVGDNVRGVALTTLMLVLAIAAATGTSTIDVALLRLAWTVVGGAFVLLAALVVKRLSAPDAVTVGIAGGTT